MFLFGVIFWNSFFHLLLSFKPAWLFVINYTNWDKKLEDNIPVEQKTTAVGVFKISSPGSPMVSNRELMTPWLDNSILQAKIRNIKFIHIGRMKIKTIKFWLFAFILLRIMARGYDRTRQIRVQIRASFKDSINALKCTEKVIELTFKKVKFPPVVVNA